MLNGKKIEIKTGGDFDPVPMDRYTVLAVDVNEVTQFNQFQGKEEEVLNYQFAILDDKPMPQKEGTDAETTRGRFLWKRCRPALNNRSWLGKLVKAIQGRDLTKEEVATFDPESIIGQQVDVMVEQNESKDGQKVFNNIISFSKTVKKLEPVVFENKTGATVEKTTTAAIAPQAEDPEEFISAVSEAGKAADSAGAMKIEKTPEELEVELAEARLAAAKAKAGK